MNPILEYRRSTIAYFLVWLAVICVHILPLTLAIHLPVHIAITEGIIDNALFAVLGLALWYPIFYGKSEDESTLYFIIRHLFACLVTVSLWFGLQHIILLSLFSTNADYLDYLRRSLPWKAATGIFYYWLIILVYYLLIYNRNMKSSLVKQAELKTLIRESELSSLKSQINPHFLFNSLNSISSLTMI